MGKGGHGEMAGAEDALVVVLDWEEGRGSAVFWFGAGGGRVRGDDVTLRFPYGLKTAL